MHVRWSACWLVITLTLIHSPRTALNLFVCVCCGRREEQDSGAGRREVSSVRPSVALWERPDHLFHPPWWRERAHVVPPQHNSEWTHKQICPHKERTYQQPPAVYQSQEHMNYSPHSVPSLGYLHHSHICVYPENIFLPLLLLMFVVAITRQSVQILTTF